MISGVIWKLLLQIRLGFGGGRGFRGFRAPTGSSRITAEEVCAVLLAQIGWKFKLRRHLEAVLQAWTNPW